MHTATDDIPIDRVGTELATALVAFQAACENLPSNREGKIPTKGGGSYSYKYADLPSVLDAVKPKLAEFGLSLIQAPCSEGERVGVRSILVHSSGETLELGRVVLPNSLGTPQGAGACITYSRRYVLGAIAGIAVDDDDDAQGHQRPASAAGSRSSKGRQDPPQKATTRQASTSEKLAAFDQPTGFGKKHKDDTWRHMSEGSLTGDRYQYLEYMSGQISEALEKDPNKKYAAKDRQALEYMRRCMEIIENREGSGDDDPDDDEAPPPSDGDYRDSGEPF